MVKALGDLMTVLSEADPADKAEVYGQLGLTLTYDPGRQEGQGGEARARVDHVRRNVSEGGLEPPCPFGALAPQASASAYSATRT